MHPPPHERGQEKFLSTLSLRRATFLAAAASFRLVFLSTLSLRRATAQRRQRLNNDRNFYPRSPCGERQWRITPKIMIKGISIHALLAESDLATQKTITVRTRPFLSTLSLRRATAKVHKTVGHFCAYETNFMEIASSC